MPLQYPLLGTHFLFTHMTIAVSYAESLVYMYLLNLSTRLSLGRDNVMIMLSQPYDNFVVKLMGARFSEVKIYCLPQATF